MPVSVCMATCNGAPYIKEQIDSILVQLSDHDELIISDDGSSDSTLEILQSYNHQTKILPARKFDNPVKNFEHSLNHCKNEIIFLADQDDIWHPEKIKV